MLAQQLKLRDAADDDAVRTVVITGGEKIFAAGADIKEMVRLGPIDTLTDIRPEYWKTIATFPKPLLAAALLHK
ncbi:enoyl-CoA hydratase-related protein [Glaciimonas soli]|uniref:Enoyl-CoA hydratase/isomerase-like protein n=1 Tax=Glaciimonas soli TaxID=2590999 RepID=A0A843YMR4_9BURK|nr:enoyl-CoA hydratase-related protein [Glaciimonas soli]MQR00220.1 hypothetical protein [Glaciimonas soli]